jgi:hypothetical protein
MTGRPAGGRLRIVVAGYIVKGPLGGIVWHHLQYVMGLARLGHDVYFLEDGLDYPACYDPTTHLTGTDPSTGLRFAAEVFSAVGLADRWGFWDSHRSRWEGPAGSRAAEICATADVYLNMSGKNPLRPWHDPIPVKALVDTDPLFTQLRHLKSPAVRADAARHSHFLTFGVNLAAGGSAIPDDGFPWRGTRQPTVIDAWPVLPPPREPKLTTVMSWDSYPAQEHEGVTYGMKSASFAPYVDLPGRTSASLELAVGSASAPKDLLRSKGWIVRDPTWIARTPWTYQEYIQGSTAELSVAKEAYASTRSGWFSERSAAYLASGRPVVVQETGFSDWLPTGLGVVPFGGVDEAVRAIEDVVGDWDRHARAARDVAVEHFESGRVLRELLAEVGA